MVCDGGGNGYIRVCVCGCAWVGVGVGAQCVCGHGVMYCVSVQREIKTTSQQEKDDRCVEWIRTSSLLLVNQLCYISPVQLVIRW